MHLIPHAQQNISGDMFSKVDLAPAENTPITVFHQRNDGHQEAISHNVMRTKPTTQPHSNKSVLDLEQRRQDTQTASKTRNEPINEIGQYGQLDNEIERSRRPSRRSPWWSIVPLVVSLTIVHCYTKTDQNVEWEQQRYNFF